MPATTQDRDLARHFVTSVPVALAATLASLYAIGTILRATELSEAGLYPRDTLPLIPIEQLLARGITAALYVLVFFLFVGPIAAVLGLWIARTTDASPSVVWLERHRRWAHPFLDGWLVAAVIMGLVFLPPLVAASAVFSGLVIALATIRHRERLWVWLVAAYLIMGSGWLASAALDPRPLPHVSITTQAGARVKGRLITHAGSTWYVTRGRRRFIALDQSTVRNVTVTSDRGEKWPRGHDYLEGLIDAAFL